MRGKTLLWVWTVFMLIGSAAMTNVVKAPVAPTVVFVDPPQNTAPPGEYFTIRVNISNVEGLNAWQFNMTWDNTVLNVTGTDMIEEGPFLKSGGSTFFIVTLLPENQIPHYMVVGATMKSAATVSGSGTIATINFKVVGEGETALHLVPYPGTKLLDVDGYSISHTTQDGYFNNIVIADLVRRSAWPEHHHFSISKDEDHIQTLYAKVKNLAEGYGFVRVNFRVWNATMEKTFTAKHTVLDVETRMAPGEMDHSMTVNLWESLETAWSPGKYNVEATCLYSASGESDTWKTGQKLKSFGFAVVP